MPAKTVGGLTVMVGAAAYAGAPWWAVAVVSFVGVVLVIVWPHESADKLSLFRDWLAHARRRRRRAVGHEARREARR